MGDIQLLQFGAVPPQHAGDSLHAVLGKDQPLQGGQLEELLIAEVDVREVGVGHPASREEQQAHPCHHQVLKVDDFLAELLEDGLQGGWVGLR